jgi:hypothetical protein
MLEKKKTAVLLRFPSIPPRIDELFGDIDPVGPT